MMDTLDGAERAMDAVTNQFNAMCHERWLAAKRIRALKAEMARRAAIDARIQSQIAFNARRELEVG